MIFWCIFSFMYHFLVINFRLFFLIWVRKIQWRLNVPSVSQFYDPVNMAHLWGSWHLSREDFVFLGGSVGCPEMAHRSQRDVKQHITARSRYHGGLRHGDKFTDIIGSDLGLRQVSITHDHRDRCTLLTVRNQYGKTWPINFLSSAPLIPHLYTQVPLGRTFMPICSRQKRKVG